MIYALSKTLLILSKTTLQFMLVLHLFWFYEEKYFLKDFTVRRFSRTFHLLYLLGIDF